MPSGRLANATASLCDLVPDLESTATKSFGRECQNSSYLATDLALVAGASSRASSSTCAIPLKPHRGNRTWTIPRKVDYRSLVGVGGGCSHIGERGRCATACPKDALRSLVLVASRYSTSATSRHQTVAYCARVVMLRCIWQTLAGSYPRPHPRNVGYQRVQRLLHVFPRRQ